MNPCFKEGARMKKETGLFKISLMETFKTKYVVKDGVDLLLNSVKMYQEKFTLQLGKLVWKQVDFFITEEDGKQVLYPVVAVQNNEYLLMAQRIVNATKIVIDAQEWVDMTIKEDGSYEFVLKD